MKKFDYKEMTNEQLLVQLEGHAGSVSHLLKRNREGLGEAWFYAAALGSLDRANQAVAELAERKYNA